MSDSLKIILCGLQSFDSQSSWSGTHILLKSAMSKRAEVVGLINYSVTNKYINWFHKKASFASDHLISSANCNRFMFLA